jgi:3-hydroxyacyl-[acyl-carrier-protein] dehydratase
MNDFQLSESQIREMIPHRYPFLFLDRVTAYEAGAFIEGYKLVTADEPFFQGHFPGRPIMPGVLITEALAQLGCVLLALELGEKAKGGTPLFLGVDKAKFRAPVEPGARLDMRLDLVSQRGGMAKVNATASQNGRVAAQAELTFMLK